MTAPLTLPTYAQVAEANEYASKWVVDNGSKSDFVRQCVDLTEQLYEKLGRSGVEALFKGHETKHPDVKALVEACQWVISNPHAHRENVQVVITDAYEKFQKQGA